eukprot:320360-Pyramimonas_sp.AAC.1
MPARGSHLAMTSHGLEPRPLTCRTGLSNVNPSRVPRSVPGAVVGNQGWQRHGEDTVGRSPAQDLSDVGVPRGGGALLAMLPLVGCAGRASAEGEVSR